MNHDLDRTIVGPGGRRLFLHGVAGCLEPAIGAAGITRAQIDARLARLAPAIADLRKARADGSLPILTIADERSDVEDAIAALQTLSQGARTIVFFGTGGSSLGGQTLAQLAGWNIPGGADSAQRKRPRTRFYDNLDPRTLASALATLDLATTRFVVTSKSGGTPETLVQAISALQAVKAAGLGARIPELFLGITEPARPGRRNGLRDLFGAHGIAMLDHHTGIGGRFSALTNVGLLPAIARGLDPFALRAGARAAVDDLLQSPDPSRSAAAVGAATAVTLAEERGARVLVMMPYADRLGSLGHWFVQLWAESLGKNGRGTTPIACLGPLDQHSQLQLFMDGPNEHYLTFLRVANAGAGPRLDADLARLAGLEEMAGRHVGDLVTAQGHAVPAALAKAARPVRTIDIDVLDEAALGGLMMHFMIETILAARLMGVDAFDQPAVELSKIIARDRLKAERPA